MPAVGGSIESISLAGRLFPVAADADAARDLGGFSNEVQSNGDGTARLIKLRKPWSLTGVAIEISDDRADQEHLQSLANAKDYFDTTITFASGVTYQGRGIFTDKIEVNSQATTAEISLSGPGELTQQ